MFFSLIVCFLSLILFKPIFVSDNIALDSSFGVFNYFVKDVFWFRFTKYLFVFSLFFSNLIIFNYLFSFIDKNSKKNLDLKAPVFGLLVGKDMDNNNIYIPEKSLYQNILVTGSIGSGKTASAMYPFTKQLINYEFDNYNKKLGFLILDVKGNYYSKVLDFSKCCNRLNDVIVIGLNSYYRYNPLDKPYLKSSVLADRI